MAGSKRQRANGSRTGGTGDIKPQYLTVSSGTNGINLYAVNQVALPVPRFGSQQGRTTVVEILSVDWYLGALNLLDGGHSAWAFLTTGSDRTAADVAAVIDLAEDIRDPLTFALVVAGGSDAHKFMPIHFDLTDNNGNGMVVATDKLFVVYGDRDNDAASEAIAKIKYRLVNIGMKEYIGIVQSQQA